MKGFLQRILQDFMKKILPGRSDAWLTSRLFHRPGKPAYHIVDWRILDEEHFQTLPIVCMKRKKLQCFFYIDFHFSITIPDLIHPTLSRNILLKIVLNIPYHCVLKSNTHQLYQMKSLIKLKKSNVCNKN